MPFHVELTRGVFRSAHLYNLTAAELERTVVAPWRAGAEIELEGKPWPLREAKLLIIEGERLEPSQLTLAQGWRNALRSGREVTAAWLNDGAAGARPAAARGGVGASPAVAAGVPADPARRRRVMLAGEGRPALDALAGYLWALGLEPQRWREPASEREPAAVARALAQAQVLAVVLKPVDPGGVLLLGMALALDPARTLAIQVSEQALEIPGVPAPVVLTRADAAEQLATRLERAGCELTREGDDWRDPARFAALRV